MKIFLVPALLAMSAATTLAQSDTVPAPPEALENDRQAAWRDLDRDMDGQLNMTEAAQALPQLIIIDLDNDGLVSRAEVEDALPGIAWEAQQDDPSDSGAASSEAQAAHRAHPGEAPAGESAARIVDEADYRMIVEALAARQRQRSSGRL